MRFVRWFLWEERGVCAYMLLSGHCPINPLYAVELLIGFCGMFAVSIAGMLELRHNRRKEKSMSKSKTKGEWICESCIYFPPSSGDGKPCCVCDPDDPALNCYCKKED